MPLSCTTPACITPAVLRNRVYAAGYLAHVALIRELLDQSPLSTNPQLLSASSNRFFQSLSGLFTNTSDIALTREPIPIWNQARVIRLCDSAEAAWQMSRAMDSKDDVSINMPCAPMPVFAGEAAEFMHPKLVTYLKGYQSYYTRGGLGPHLTKKGFFWKSQAPAIHNVVLQYKLFIDRENAAHLEKLERIECGHVPPHSRVHFYNGVTGLHNSLGPDCTLKNVQYWISRTELPPRQPHRVLEKCL